MCDNFETYYVPSGWNHKEVKTKCGNTKHDGSRAICDACANDPEKMNEIERSEANIAADNAWAHSAGWGDF